MRIRNKLNANGGEEAVLAEHIVNKPAKAQSQTDWMELHASHRVEE